MRYADLYVQARKKLTDCADPETASLYARNLLCAALQKPYEAIVGQRDFYASEAECNYVFDGVERLLHEEPLAYILNEWDFCGSTFYVDRSVLIPRDDTCAVVSLAMNYALFLDSTPRILDLCTGSGCIGITVAKKIHDARVTLADISRDALNVAKRNVKEHKLTDRISCVCLDARQEAPAYLSKFDLIISNPPYITTSEMETLDKSVREYEPHLALHGGADGLDFYRAISANFASVLKPGGYLCFEFGFGQADSVRRILEENQYKVLDISKDYTDKERAIIAQYGRKEA